MAEPAIQCPLCKRVVKIIGDPGTLSVGVFAVRHHPPIVDRLMLEEHSWLGEMGDLIDRLHCVQYSTRCPMSKATVERKS